MVESEGGGLDRCVNGAGEYRLRFRWRIGFQCLGAQDAGFPSAELLGCEVAAAVDLDPVIDVYRADVVPLGLGVLVAEEVLAREVLKLLDQLVQARILDFRLMLPAGFATEMKSEMVSLLLDMPGQQRGEAVAFVLLLIPGVSNPVAGSM